MALSSRGCLRNAIWATTVMVLGLFLTGGTASAATTRTPKHSPSPSASPGTVKVTDDSHVLSKADKSSLRETAADIEPPSSSDPEPVWIYTTKDRSGDKKAFDQHYTAMLRKAPDNVIIIAVNTKSRHLIITSGPLSELSDSGADQAREDFTTSFQSDSSYGNALNAALRTIRSSVAEGASSSFSPEPAPTYPATAGSTHHSGGAGIAILVILGIAVLVVISAASRRTVGSSIGSGGRRSYGYSNQTIYQDTNVALFDSGGSDWSDGDSGGDWGGGDSGGSSSGDF
jgi:uncharacterized membrane protein YgcG